MDKTFKNDKDASFNGLNTSLPEDINKIISGLDDDNFFRQMFWENPTVMLLIDPGSQKILYANKAAENFYGYSLKEFIDSIFIYHINLLTETELQKEIQYVRKGYKSHFVFKHKLKNGEIRDVEIFSNNIEIKGFSFLISYINDITSRRQMENLLVDSETRYRNIVEASPNAMHFYRLDDDKLIFTGANPSADKMLGIDHRRLLNQQIEIAFPALAETSIVNMYKKIARGELELQQFEQVYSDERFFGNYQVFAFKSSPKHLTVIFLDITKQKKTEKELVKLNQLYSVISQVNQVIVRTADKRRLFSEICDIVIKFGKFRFAWIGISDKTKNKLIPVAWSGEESGYLRTVKINLPYDDDENNPPAVAAARNTYFICNNVTGSADGAWKEECLKRNFNSVISLPVREKGSVSGTLNIYSNEINFFQNEEINLFTEIADDISFALDSIEKEKQRLAYETALEENEKIFQLFMHYSPVYMFFKDSNIKSIRLSSNYEKMLGRPVNELLYKDMNELFPGDVAEKMIEDDKRILKEQKVVEVEEELDGRFYNTIKFPILINNKPRYLAGFTMDITEKKLSEKKLKESENRFATLAESSFEGILITSENVILEINNQMCEMLGYTRDELIGTYASDLLPPDSRTLLKPLDILNSNDPFEFMVKRKNGTIFPVEIRGRNIPYSGKVARVTAIRDITERKKMIEALFESEKQFRSVIENASVGVCLISLEDYFLKVNDAFVKFIGYSEKELLKLTFYDITHHEDRRRSYENVRKLASTEVDNFSLQKRYITKNGDTVWALVSVSSLKNDKNQTYQRVVHVQDITQLKDQEVLIEKSEANLKALIDNRREAIWTTDKTFNILIANEYFKNTYPIFFDGNFDQHFLFHSAFLFVEGKFWKDKYVSVLNGKKEVFELTKSINEEIRYFEVSLNPVWLEMTIIGISGIMREITDRKKYENELRESRETYKKFFEEDLTGDFIATSDGDLINCNPAFINMMGYKNKEQALNTNLKSLYFSATDRITMLNDILSQKKLEQREYMLRRADGKRIFVIANIIGSFDSNENLLGIKGYLIDNTERKLAEIELRKLSEAVRQSPVMVIITDISGKIEYANPVFCSTTDTPLKKILNKNVKTLKTSNTSNSVYSALSESVFNSSEWSGEICITPNENHHLWIYLYITKIKSADGKHTHFLALGEDITDAKKNIGELIAAKEKAESLNKAKTVFLANMSHELRTPLVGILGYSELMAKELSKPEFREMAEGINRTGTRLLKTLSLVLDLTRVESDKFEIYITGFDIIPVIREAFNNFKGSVSVKSLEYKLITDVESLVIRTDMEMVKVIFENLINNAVKFTDEGSIIIQTGIELSGKKHNFYFKVTDTGIGIKKKDISKIYEEFRQLSEGTTKSYPGTGLGLPITKKYVELLNGRIKVDSKPGVGSTFKVTLPL